MLVENTKQTRPAATPIASAPIGPAVPEAGVIATRPATAPEAMPSTEGFPCDTHSANIQASAAAAVATCVTSIAIPADCPALTALPALKPNQPTQSIEAPMTVSARLCGGMGVVG